MDLGIHVFKKGSAGAVVMADGGRKPVYLAAHDTTDPHAVALAELLFWTDILGEHLRDIARSLPIEDLASERDGAVIHKGIFEMLHERAKETDVDDKAAIQALSEAACAEADAVTQYQRTLEKEQKEGKIYTLTWPLFVDHATREAERFAARQRMMIIDGEVRFNRKGLIQWWAEIMAEHSAFIAHRLDPAETVFNKKALDFNKRFLEIWREHGVEKKTDTTPSEIYRLIEFKVELLEGVESGRVRSMFHPYLVDHIRREAIMFVDELIRADRALGIEPQAA